MQKRHKDSLSLRFYPYKMLTCSLLMNGSLWTTLKWFQGLFGLALTALVVSPVSSAPASTFNAFSPFNDATTNFNSQNNGFDTKVQENLKDMKVLLFHSFTSFYDDSGEMWFCPRLFLAQHRLSLTRPSLMCLPGIILVTISKLTNISALSSSSTPPATSPTPALALITITTTTKASPSTEFVTRSVRFVQIWNGLMVHTKSLLTTCTGGASPGDRVWEECSSVWSSVWRSVSHNLIMSKLPFFSYFLVSLISTA